MRRKLSAILAADVVGYAALMEKDEAGTFDRLRAGRKELFEPEIGKHHGRIFKLMGDGLLAEFASVVDAVECAVSLQRGLAERNANAPEDQRIQVRIGINLGEVIVEGEDRYGEGVNVAARLEQLADPGGICVSAKVAHEVEKKLAFGFTSMGDQYVKNIAEPVPAYRVVLDGVSNSGRTPAPLALPSKPSIAILPFQNMSGDPEQEYFADGVVEEIITALSRLRWLFVIARNSTFAYKGKAVDIRQVAKELGVHYVLEGSVRKAANRLRITGQLVEGDAGTHVWAGKFEGTLEDIFDLQDRMTENIVGAIEPSIRRAEIERARHKRPDRLDSYDLYLRALPHAVANTQADSDQALHLLNEALRLDPNYAAAHAYAAWCHQQRFRNGLLPDDRAAALRHAEAAIRDGMDDPQALSIGAFAQALITHDFANAIALLDQALEMNGNSALTLRFLSQIHAFSGRYDRAIEHALKALRLSPVDPMNYHPYLALAVANYFTGRFGEAIGFSVSAIQANPGFSLPHAFLVASNVSLGHLEAARAAAQRLLQVDPTFSVGKFEQLGYIRQSLLDQVCDALRTAGLP
jgi:TolB-like protein/class 3 adenylate cyclase